MARRKNLGTCVICGKCKAVTKDHVPPRGIFCKPRPNNLVKVPACHKCNNLVSGLDERFRVYLGLHVSSGDNMGKKFFREEAIRTLNHNRKLLKEILLKAKPVSLSTRQGIIYDTGLQIPWDSLAHDVIVERTIRGFYYHHYGDILGDRVRVKVQWLRQLTPDLIDKSRDWSFSVLGKGEVAYKYGRSQNSPLESVWIFQFYKAHWASGYTIPVL